LLPQSVREAGVNRTLKHGEFLFRIDTRTVGLFEVIKGKIKLVRIDRSGRETILYVASAGDTVAEASLFSPAYHCDAIAATDSVVRLYPKSALFVLHSMGIPRRRIESDSLHAIFRIYNKVQTKVATTDKAVVVTQTSADKDTVAYLQKPASEMSDFVAQGMTAMRTAMVKKMGGMIPADMYGMMGNHAGMHP
jgi:CRP-like cAMP-binding protein